MSRPRNWPIRSGRSERLRSWLASRGRREPPIGASGGCTRGGRQPPERKRGRESPRNIFWGRSTILPVVAVAKLPVILIIWVVRALIRCWQPLLLLRWGQRLAVLLAVSRKGITQPAPRQLRRRRLSRAIQWPIAMRTSTAGTRIQCIL